MTAMPFSWVTAAWSAAISACLTLALLNLLVWASDRTSWSHLLFATASISNAVLGVLELGVMRESTPERMTVLIRWAHVPLAITVCALVGFVRLYLGAGRPWLGVGGDRDAGRLFARPELPVTVQPQFRGDRAGDSRLLPRGNRLGP